MHGDDRGQAEDAEQGQRHQDDHDGQRQPDVLQHDRAGAVGVVEDLREVTQVLAHERHVGGLDGDVGAHGAHGDAEVGRGQRGRVVDPVADHRGDPFAAEVGHQPRLVLRAQLGVYVGSPGAMRLHVPRR